MDERLKILDEISELGRQIRALHSESVDLLQRQREIGDKRADLDAKVENAKARLFSML